MEYLKKEIRTFQNGKTVNDQFYIDDDYNVPDAKKAVGRIIISDGTLQVEEMKQVENYLKVTGKLEFRVMYTADETIPEPTSLEGRIPLKKTEYQDTCRDYDRNGKICGRRAHNRYRRRKSCI